MICFLVSHIALKEMLRSYLLVFQLKLLHTIIQIIIFIINFKLIIIIKLHLLDQWLTQICNSHSTPRQKLYSKEKESRYPTDWWSFLPFFNHFDKLFFNFLKFIFILDVWFFHPKSLNTKIDLNQINLCYCHT